MHIKFEIGNTLRNVTEVAVPQSI